MSKEGTELVKAIAAGINRYFGCAIEQGVGILEDRFRFMRWERQLKLMDRANKILDERGLESPSCEIPQKFLLPYLEASTLEEEESLQEKWAYLLANAADANCTVQLKRNFISILENLTSFESKMFEGIARNEIEGLLHSDKKAVSVVHYPDRIILSPDKLKIGLSHEIETALNNLIRLGLLYNQSLGSSPEWVSVTGLGKEFYNACN